MVSNQSLSSALSGVLYAEDFDDPAPRVAAPGKSTPAAVTPAAPESVTPRFSLDELRAATEQAHQEGRVLERTAAKHSETMSRNTALAALGDQLRLAQEQAARIVEHGIAEIACTTMSLLTAALPSLCTLHAEDEIRALLRRVLPATRQLSELHIRLHPSLRQMVEGEIAQLLEGSSMQICWAETSKLAPGDIAITWQNGSAVRDTEACCKSIRDAVFGLFSGGDGNQHRMPERHDDQ